MSQAYAEAVENRRQASRDAGGATLERAVGLLAGRAHCRMAEAHRHLLRMAADQKRDLADVAAGVVRLLDVAEPDPAGPDPAVPRSRQPAVAELVEAAMAAPPPGAAPLGRLEPWVAMVQRVLDVSQGAAAYFAAERDPAGRLVDLVWVAASPEAVAPTGLRGVHLVGHRLSAHFPEVVGSDRWQVYQRVLDSGHPAEVGPFRSGPALVSVRAHRLGQGLLLTWTRHDEHLSRQSDRVASTERLGNLGWVECDLVSGEISWSEQLYRIYERDPRLGPLAREESEAMILAEDAPLHRAAVAAFARSERVDLTVRVRIGGRVKHLRTVADAVRDAAGRPLRIFGIVQDVTAQETGALRLAEVERELDEQRRSLAAEHELAGRLQRIILPIPDGPIELPGLKVALRYLPAGRESLVGGDWYHAAELRDGSVLLAVGDVAGHGTPAATTMAQLRHALRALAVTTTDPGELLGHLNRLTCDLERETPELSATAVLARFDPVRRELLWAQAGHPPPLLNRNGRTAPLTRPAGPMLGVVDDAVYPTARLDFRIGDVLLLYTDGLVEHRRRGPDDGMAAVMAAVDDAVRASPQQPLAQLLARLRQANPDDDTCILAARPVTGETRDLRRHLSAGGRPPRGTALP